MLNNIISHTTHSIKKGDLKIKIFRILYRIKILTLLYFQKAIFLENCTLFYKNICIKIFWKLIKIFHAILKVGVGKTSC